MTKKTSRKNETPAEEPTEKLNSNQPNPEKDAHIALVEALYDKVRKSVGKMVKEKGVSASNIFIIIDAVMKIAGDLKTTSGYEKKLAVIAVVKKLIEESSLKPEDEELIKIIVERALDPTIDQLFALAPSVYGKAKAKCLGLCTKKK